MKRLLLFLFSLFLIQANVNAQALLFDTDTSTCVGSATDFEVSCENHVKNQSGSNDSIIWVRTILDAPAAWDIAVCDKNYCYPPNVASKSYMSFNNETSLMKVLFRPNNTAGTGVVKVHVYAKSDSADANNTAYYVFNTTTGLNNPQEIKNIFMYPTPVRENMYVLFNPNLKPSRIDVFNVLGQKIKTFPVQIDRNNSRVELQLSELDKGMYFVRVYQTGSNTVITRQFTKE